MTCCWQPRTLKDCEYGTRCLLRELGRLGYRASGKKAQLCRREVTFLGYVLRDGKRWLTKARKEAVAQIPAPTTRKQRREFLGMAERLPGVCLGEGPTTGL